MTQMTEKTITAYADLEFAPLGENTPAEMVALVFFEGPVDAVPAA